MKTWLTEHFLPLWAKETVLADNRHLTAENFRLRRKNKELEAYVAGMHMALKAVKRLGGERV